MNLVRVAHRDPESSAPVTDRLLDLDSGLLYLVTRGTTRVRPFAAPAAGWAVVLDSPAAGLDELQAWLEELDDRSVLRRIGKAAQEARPCPE